MADDTAYPPAMMKPVPQRTRFEVFRRDDYTCRYCGGKPPDVQLTIDHVIPRALGGGDEPSNLVTACQPCNAGKGSTSPDEHVVADVDAAAVKWAAAMERASQIERERSSRRDTETGQFYDHWTAYYSPSSLPGGWAGSVHIFLDRGLTIEDLFRLAYAPADRNVRESGAFRYFAGACWTTIRERARIAKALLDEEETD